MSIQKRPVLGLILLAPLVAFVLISVSTASVLIDSARRVHTAEAVAEFAARAAVVLDDLQRERADLARARLTTGAPAQADAARRWSDTDATIANLLALTRSEESPISEGARLRLSASLSGLEAARRSAVDPDVELTPAVEAYSAVIGSFLDALAVEFGRSDLAEPRFGAAFLMLARLHERFGVETFIGETAFAAGDLDRRAHPALITAITPQGMLASVFSKLAGPHWATELDRVLAGAPQDRLEAARSALIEAGYEAPLDMAHSAFWRTHMARTTEDLAVLRNRFAQDGIGAVVGEAAATRAAAVRSALIQLIVLLLAAAASSFGVWRISRGEEPAGDRAAATLQDADRNRTTVSPASS